MISFIVKCIVLTLSLFAVTQFRVAQNAFEITGTEYKNSLERPAPPALVWKQDRPIEGFKLSFEARYDDNSYGNFFQTSDGQNSIRLEVQPPGKVFLILAETTVAPLKGDWRKGDWHRLSLEATKGGIDISVDGQPALHSVAPGGWVLDNVAVGTGLGMKRGLIGGVRDVRLVVASPSSLSSLLFIFVVAIGSLLYAFLCKSLSAPSSFPWTDGGLTSPPLAAALFGIGVFANGSVHLPNAWLVAPACFGLAAILLAVLRDKTPASVRLSELRSVLTASLLVLIPLALVFGVIGLRSSAIGSITYWLIGALAPVAVAVLGPDNTPKGSSGRWTSLLTTALGCMAIVCTVTLCLQNDLWSAPIVGLALALALRWTVPPTGTIGYLRPLYWTGASLVLVAISTKLAASHLELRPLLGLVATAIIFAFTDRMLFARISPKHSIELFFLPLAFNLSILALSYLSTSTLD
ncbi:hypothetical protein [Rhodopseudomonas sp.]|uniref:hypothetical protein n=1 Tax=Rhodopseudomonas sp. TaxID=1078 RepID=UPI0039E5BAD2